MIPADPRKPRRAPRPPLQQALTTLATPAHRRTGRPPLVRPAHRLALLDQQLLALLQRGAAVSALELCAALGPRFAAEPERAVLWEELDRFTSPVELVHWRLRALRQRGLLAQTPTHHTDRFAVRAG